MDSIARVQQSMESYYRDFFSKYGACKEGAAWGADENRLHTRWQMMLKLVSCDPKGVFPRPSLLDVGCSYGGMYAYAKNNGFNIKYCGIDVVEDAIKVAAETHPEASFLCNDCFTFQTQHKFDYVLGCGIFGVKGKVSHRDMRIYWKATIMRMFELCDKGIAFNVFSSNVNEFDVDAFYMSPVEVLAFCLENMSDKVILHTATELFDCFVYVYK